MAKTSVIEISKSAVISNINFIKKQLGNDTKLTSVVKANAYGHGIKTYIPLVELAGVDHFSVFSADEAFEVYNVKRPETDIMVMGWMDDDDQLAWAIENGIEFFVFETMKIRRIVELAPKIGKPALIHLEVETGMNRTGLNQKSLQAVVKIIRKNPSLFVLKGLCTHLAGAESIANHVRVQKQLARYKKICKWMTYQGLVPAKRHVASSAAAMTYPASRYDMVRVGILQYGFWPSAETFIQYISKKEEKQDPLRRVIRWKTRIMSIKKVKQGEFVSYGTSYIAHEDKVIAVVPVGYSHGYSRSLSNQGRVLINGQRVVVIGLVNMNMLIADITKIPDVKVGDEVVLIGRQGDSTITVASFGEFSDQLNYELLTRLPLNIPRVVVN